MSKQTIIIYSPVLSERLFFTCNIIFNIILNVDYKIIKDSKSLNISSNEVIINYSDTEIKNTFQVIPSGLLAETTIEKQNLLEGKYNNLPVLFSIQKGDIPFDIFSAVFFIVSRYEEYLDFDPDQYGRFKAEDSIAYKLDFLHLPIVEMWTYNLAAQLKIDTEKAKYKHLLTIDIDNAWKYKNKGFFKTYGGVLFSFISGRFQESKDRIATITGQKQDPAETYEYLNSIDDKLEQPIQYFILVGRNRKHDNALSILSSPYKKLLLKISQKNRPGFHPSYESNRSFKIVFNEYYKLCSIFTRRIVKSRQHYLKFHFPETFRNLIKLSIREEHSLGWSSQIGFRAGISRPFPFSM